MTDNLLKWIRGSNSGKIWLTKLVSKTTIEQYLPLLKAYCDACGKTPDELIGLKMEGQRQVGTPKEFQAEELHDITINEIDRPVSIKDKMSQVIKSFYRHNRRPLTTVKMFDTPTPKQRTPSLEEIEEMASVAKTRRDEAMIWFLSTAPLREETLSLLKWSDFVETGDKELPLMINIEAERLKGKGKGKYKGNKQICFLNHFVCDKILRYTKEIQGKGIQVNKDDSVFIVYRNGNGEGYKALSTGGIRDVFTNASFDSWHDLEQKRYSPHDFRNFVNTMMEKARISDNWRAIILGHKPRGIRGKHYSDPEINELKEQFKEILPFIIPTHKQETPTKEALQKSFQFMTDTAWQMIKLQYDNLNEEVQTLKALMQNAKTEEAHNILEVQLTMKKDQLQKYKQMIDKKNRN